MTVFLIHWFWEWLSIKYIAPYRFVPELLAAAVGDVNPWLIEWFKPRIKLHPIYNIHLSSHSQFVMKMNTFGYKAAPMK